MRKRFLWFLIPSVLFLLAGLVGVGFGSYFIVAAQSPQEVSNIGEAFGVAFALVIILTIGIVVLVFGALLILIGTPLFIGGLSTYKKDKKTYLENKENNERVVEKS